MTIPKHKQPLFRRLSADNQLPEDTSDFGFRISSLLLSWIVVSILMYSSVNLLRAQAGSGQPVPPHQADAPARLRTMAFAPFLDLVPSEDGQQVFIRVAGLADPCETVYVNLDGIQEVPTGFKESYSMLPAEDACVTTAGGFPAQTSVLGKIHITTTLGTTTEPLKFLRAFVPAFTPKTLHSADGNLELTLVNSDTLTVDTYIAIVPSYAPPRAPAVGHTIIGSSYSVRAAGALLNTTKPMNLRLYYNDTLLAGSDPHTLVVFAWDPNTQTWDALESRLFSTQRYLNTVTQRFTTYALMRTPTWQDGFDDFSGLDLTQLDNITLGQPGVDRALVLDQMPGNGTAVSQPITLPDNSLHWQTVTFAAQTHPPTTDITVDILAADGTLLQSAVTSGSSLAHIDPTQHPSLRLRARLTSTATDESPALSMWQLSWQSPQQKVYLPAIMTTHP